MAPRKEKAEKVSADEAADSILNYLRKQNRPYSATDVSANLHNKVTKAAAVKILKDLHEQKKIEGRTAGKQIVYHAVQDSSEALSSEQLAAYDAQIEGLRTDASVAQATAKSLRVMLSTLNSTLSTADLRVTLASQQARKAEILERLKAVREGKTKPVTAKQREEVEKEIATWSKVCKNREKIVREIWGVIEEDLPEGLNKDEVREGLGLDD